MTLGSGRPLRPAFLGLYGRLGGRGVPLGRGPLGRGLAIRPAHFMGNGRLCVEMTQWAELMRIPSSNELSGGGSNSNDAVGSQPSEDAVNVDGATTAYPWRTSHHDASLDT